jgi:cytochrome oxidase assembly protein ShyY1
MWRTALRPRWLALLLVVLAAASVMAWLGSWQLDRARQQGQTAQRERLTRPPVELTSLFGARQRFPAEGADRPVKVTGRWQGSDQLLVVDRRQPATDQVGFWVLTPLRMADGSVVAVVRGFAETPQAAGVSLQGLPAGPVELSGVLRPGEPAVVRAPGQTSGLPAGQIDRIDPVELIERWDGPLVTGYVVAVPAVGTGLAEVPLVSDRSGLALQNVSYAVQWWIFAGFGVWLWWRLVRDDHRGVLSGRSGGGRDGTEPVPAGSSSPGRMEP